MFNSPNILHYVLLYVNLICVELGYLENLAISKWFSFPLQVYLIITPLTITGFH